ncbi:hypothetical protein SK128_018900 [Halocaridina rubra]|uniref:Uncharacterized protein n=1 Tax=Halocaridina rubra TaxID=373956 RepID=A0AAN9AG34_HALRR
MADGYNRLCCTILNLTFDIKVCEKELCKVVKEEKADMNKVKMDATNYPSLEDATMMVTKQSRWTNNTLMEERYSHQVINRNEWPVNPENPALCMQC